MKTGQSTTHTSFGIEIPGFLRKLALGIALFATPLPSHSCERQKINSVS